MKTKSICNNPKPKAFYKKYMPLGRSIRQGFVDGISEDNSPLMRGAFDEVHGEVDPYFSFGNDIIGRDKFDRAVKLSKARESMAKDTGKKSTEPTPEPTPEPTSEPTPEPTPSE